MSKINVLATAFGKPIKSKSGFKDLILTSPELVKIVPITPSPALVSAVSAYDVPVDGTFVAHSPTGRKWTAQFTRTESHVFRVK